MTDMSCLAEGYVVPADFESTGLNLNEIVVGPTGCGKSMSNAYSRLLHTTNSSVVVPIAKKGLKDKFTGMFLERGYEVLDLNYAHPEKSEVGYDPMDYITCDEDVIQIARRLVEGELDRERSTSFDPYWNDSATSILAAEIALVRLNAKTAGRKPCFADVIELHRSMKTDAEDGIIKTNLDKFFEAAEKKYPGNQACELWKTIRGLSSKTSSCILSVVNSAVDKLFSENVIRLMQKEKRVDFKKLGQKKTVLFITTSPMNKSLQLFINVMYSDMFSALFESAEANEYGRLELPVHIICDDFACGSKIMDFEDYISIFRAAGISVTMLLQSESQLKLMYGEAAATTIINNCDTYVYMGGMDIETCRHVSQRMDKPLNKVMSMPLEQVVVFRRGSEPKVSRRYQTLADPVYLEMINLSDGKEEMIC